MNDMALIAAAAVVGVIAISLTVSHLDEGVGGERVTQAVESAACERGVKIYRLSCPPSAVITGINGGDEKCAADLAAAQAKSEADIAARAAARKKAAEDAESNRRRAKLKAEIDNAYRRQAATVDLDQNLSRLFQVDQRLVA